MEAVSYINSTHVPKLTPPSGVFGPLATSWYKILQSRINLSSKPLTIASRVAADQLVFTPVHMGIFLSTMSVLEGTSPADKLRRAYAPAIKANWMVWPFVQGVNFSVVPLEHRVLVVNVVSLGEFLVFGLGGDERGFANFWVCLGWNCYLSYLNSQK